MQSPRAAAAALTPLALQALVRALAAAPQHDITSVDEAQHVVSKLRSSLAFKELRRSEPD